MRQLELFRGEHLALARCRTALECGDLRAARKALASSSQGSREAPDARRLAELDKRLALLGEGSADASNLHEAFESVLEAPAEPEPGGLDTSDWFRLYASSLARALEPVPEERYRGWCGLHFALAAGRPAEALRCAERLTSAGADGWAWLEAARAAAAVEDAGRARRWTLVACLTGEVPLDPDPPPIAPVRTALLNPPPHALPRLPPALEELWAEAEELDLPQPVSTWIPVLGSLDGTLPASLLREPDVVQGSGFDPAAAAPEGEPAPRKFLRALLAARRARERDPAAQRGTCGEQELHQRVAMRRLAPPLFERYLARVGML
ncbi:MAG: hypothetical protein V3V67_10625 [Myxococcota bacterium]